nr:uncharacterized protein LOC115841589 [Globicephala melas]
MGELKRYKFSLRVTFRGFESSQIPPGGSPAPGTSCSDEQAEGPGSRRSEPPAGFGVGSSPAARPGGGLAGTPTSRRAAHPARGSPLEPRAGLSPRSPGRGKGPEDGWARPRPGLRWAAAGRAPAPPGSARRVRGRPAAPPAPPPPAARAAPGPGPAGRLRPGRAQRRAPGAGTPGLPARRRRWQVSLGRGARVPRPGRRGRWGGGPRAARSPPAPSRSPRLTCAPGRRPAARPGRRRRFLLVTSWGGARRPRRPFHFPEAAGRPAGRWRRRRRLGPSPSSPRRSSRGPGAHPEAQPAPGRPGGDAATRRPRATAAQDSSPRSPLLAPACGRPGLSSKLTKEELPKDPLSSRYYA